MLHGAAMINKTHGTDPQPFAGLTPEVVLDAAAAFGLVPDGRLFALNSYENRVYQLGAGDTQLVLKFYGRSAGAMHRLPRSISSPPSWRRPSSRWPRRW